MTRKKINHTNLIFIVTVIFLIITLTGLALKLIINKDKYIEVEIIGAGGDWWWQTPAPPYWLTESFHSGDIEYGVDGKVDAQILTIQSYEQTAYGQYISNKQFIARLKLRAQINKNKKTIIYKGTEIHIGDPLSIKPTGRNMTGNITWVEGLPDTRESVRLEVVAKAYERFPWFADSIKKGLTMTDDSGHVIAEVKDVKVTYTEMTVTTSVGNVYARLNPLKRDILLTMELQAVKSDNRFLFAPDQLIKIGNSIWFYSPDINLDDLKVISFKEIQ